MNRRLQRGLFITHGVVTLAAAVVLVVVPAVIPSAVGISMDADEYLLSYFLAAAEICIAVLSLAAVRLRHAGAVRLIALSFATFHGATAILEVVYTLAEGGSAVLLANIVVRVIAAGAFLLVAQRRLS
jgi:hypothetical protein